MAAGSNRRLRRHSTIVALGLMTAFSSRVRSMRSARSNSRRARSPGGGPLFLGRILPEVETPVAH